ncbi:MAG: hflC [Gammaproteobacteria bacterium]|nr:hflC [Gammaproteobacteria bacterium]
MKVKSIFIGLMAVGAVAAYFACTVVEPYQQAVIFKQSSSEILKPGFYVNVPFTSSIQKMDMRTQAYTVASIAATTQDKSNLLIDAAVLWNIQDVQAYAKATHADPAQINSWLNQSIAQAIQQAVSKKTIVQVLGVPSNSFTQSLSATLVQGAQQRGIQILDINLQNIAYAPDMLSQVYQSMQSSVNSSVNQINANGQQESAQITAQGKAAADAVINNAYVQAATIKGQAEAKAQVIYNQAYSKDPQFYAFWRSMQLYQELFTSKNTVLVVKPQGQFLQYLNSYKP